MPLTFTRISPTIDTFIDVEDEDEFVMDDYGWFPLDDNTLAQIRDGTLSEEERTELFQCFKDDLECGFQLFGGIVHAPTTEDVEKLNIHSFSDICRVLGYDAETALREWWDYTGDDERSYDELSNNEREALFPEGVYAGRAGQYLFLGYGWTC